MRTLATVVAAAALVLAAAHPAAAAPRTLPATLDGVTVDDVSNLGELRDSLAALHVRPTARIVFDPGTTPADYRAAVTALRPVAYLMGQLADSESVRSMSTAAYRQRTRQFLGAFRSQVDVWEVGNEVNGEWLGSTSSVVAKVHDAYQQVHAAGGKTALTLYYNPGCWGDPAHQMIPWTSRNIPADMKRGLDYVLVSYYEDDCNNYRPSLAEWNRVFGQLAQMFPHARVGFGENGTEPDEDTSYKAEQLAHYYTLPVSAPRYVGGHFWWYYTEDMLPHAGNPLWQELDRVLR